MRTYWNRWITLVVHPRYRILERTGTDGAVVMDRGDGRRVPIDRRFPTRDAAVAWAAARSESLEFPFDEA